MIFMEYTFITILLILSILHGNNATQVRLIGGSTPLEGTIQLYHNGAWGTVCDDSFDGHDAAVICRMLGYMGSSTAYSGAHFGSGSGSILLDELACTGREDDIASCGSNGWGSHDCQHSEDAGVRCSPGFIRLLGGQGNYEGTVDVNDGAICDFRFTDNDADVICRQLDFSSGKAVKGSLYGDIFRGSITQDFIGCHGNETRVQQCPHFRASTQTRSCTSDHVAGVICEHTPVRLVGGVLPSEGRLEVQHAGAWGTVCNHGFELQDANVVCRMLGYNTSAISASFVGALGAASGPIWLSGVGCNGSEVDIDKCRHSGWDNNTCDHKQDVAIKCKPSDVRLTGGPGPWEGSLEVKLDGQNWKYVCDDDMSFNEAKVICAMLGYDRRDSTEVLYHNIGFSHTSSHDNGAYRCNGYESDIVQCAYKQRANCTNGAVGIRCEGTKVRLVDGTSDFAGRLELYHNGHWGTVCDRDFDDIDATVICKMIAFYPTERLVAGSVVPGAYFGHGSGPVHLSNVGCYGNESDVTRCPGDWSGGVNCDHSHDTGVICNPFIEMRLEGGNSSSQGTLMFYYGGQWNTYCNNGWNTTDLQVICRELGFWTTKPRFIPNVYSGRSVNSHNVNPFCRGTEGSLEFCSNAITRHTCPSSTFVNVDCNPTQLNNLIRLVDGPGPWKGRLELFSDGHWGSICASYWNQTLTDMVCRNLYYTRSNATWYPAPRGFSPVHFRSMECDGWASHIGQCRVDSNITECVPSTDTVGIDCSGGLSLSLGNSSNLSGEVLFHTASTTFPLSLCQFSINSNVAVTLCTMAGYADTSPVVSGVHSNNSLMYSRLGCDGWESHISQCLATNNTGSNCIDKAAVSCFNCTREYTGSTGSASSENYPGTYPPDTDCLLIIKPPTNKPYKLQFQDLTLSGDGDYVEIRDSAHGQQLGYFESTTDVPSLVSDHGFYIRFKTNSAGGARGFNLSWSELQVEDAMDLHCEPGGWNVAVNTTILKQLYPETGVSQIKLGGQYCTGKVQGDLVVFSQSYTECSTTSQTTGDSVAYGNSIIYPDSTNPFPLIVHGYKWKVEIECDVDRRDTVVNNFHPNQTINHHVPHVTSSGHYSTEVKFYSDGTFYTQIHGNPVTMNTGDDVYVAVTMNSNDVHVKMRLDTCYTKPDPLADPALTYPLIQNGCPVDPDTHILSQGTHETRFVFNAFEFPASHDNVYIFCNATYCKTSDTSQICTQTCRQGGGPPIVGRSLWGMWTDVNKYRTTY